jgi:hypothetical protein
MMVKKFENCVMLLPGRFEQTIKLGGYMEIYLALALNSKRINSQKYVSCKF